MSCRFQAFAFQMGRLVYRYSLGRNIGLMQGGAVQVELFD
jgi:hypothetical protein